MQDLIQEIRLALRWLVRAPRFSLVAVATLALGVGATTSIFTVVDGVLLRPLPYRDPDRLVTVYSSDPKQSKRQPLSGADFLDIQAEGRSFEDLGAFRGLDFVMLGQGLPQRVTGASVTPNLFAVLGVRAALGRTLSSSDEPGSPRAVVLSHQLWWSRFGGRRDVLGEALELDDAPYEVVGVMPAGFDFPHGVALWTSPRYRVPDPPLDMGADPATIRDFDYLSVIARLRPGTGIRAAQAEMDGLAGRIAGESEGTAPRGLEVVSLHDDIVGGSRDRLLLLVGAVGFLLLIACANVAGLLLVRASRREREVALRMALGASRLRLFRQLLIEGSLLALGGGLLGALLAMWGTDALLALAPEGIPRAGEIVVDLRVLAFTLLLVAGTGVAFGLAPAAQALRQDLRAATNEGAGSTARRAKARLRRALVVGELAVSFVLLVGAGLLIRTLVTLEGVDPGFDPHRTLVAHLTLPDSRYREDQDVIQFLRRLLQGVRALPGVESAGTVLTLPMHWNIRATLRFYIEGRVTEPADAPVANYQIASPGYFETLRIPLLRGRSLTEHDEETALPVAVINQAFAARYWRGEDPIGRRIAFGDPDADGVEWVRIVGIVGDTRIDGLDGPPVPEAYLPYSQSALNFTTLVVRSDVGTESLAAAIRRVVAGIDPEQPLHGVASMEEVLAGSLDQRRFTMTLLALFAAMALVLAAVGLYGVLSFSVAQREREIGIRRALGAQTAAVVVLVARQGARLLALGLGLGWLASLALSRFIASQIHGVSAADPTSYGLGALVLAAIALVSSLVPALRAARVDPATILRAE